MKTAALFSVLALGMTIAIATTSKASADVANPAVTLTCRSIDNNDLFKDLKLTMTLPDDQGGTVSPGKWRAQTVKASFTFNDEIQTESTRLHALTNGRNLSGRFAIGSDFGTANMILSFDEDNKEVVAMLTNTTDGPMNVEVKRCR